MQKNSIHQLTRLASPSSLCRFLDGLPLSSSMTVSSEAQDKISRMTVSLLADSALEFASWELLDKVSFKSVVQEKETGQNNTNLFYFVTIKKLSSSLSWIIVSNYTVIKRDG